MTQHAYIDAARRFLGLDELFGRGADGGRSET
jgi:hypothetical protein